MSSTIISILFGTLFLVVGVAMYLKQHRSAQNCTAAVTAEVTDYITEVHTDPDHADSEIYYPVMRYYANGQWYEKKYEVGNGSKKYAVGDKVEILYESSKPENFIIPGDKTNLILSVVFAVVGIGLIIFALLTYSSH